MLEDLSVIAFKKACFLKNLRREASEFKVEKFVIFTRETKADFINLSPCCLLL